MSKRKKTGENNNKALPSALIGTDISKEFDGVAYHGEVIKYDPKEKYFKIRYDDGDREEMDIDEVQRYAVAMPTDAGGVVAAAAAANKSKRGSKKSTVKTKKAKTKAAAKGKTAKTKADKPGTTVYKVQWTAKKTIEEYADSAFDDCYGTEIDDAVEMYKEDEYDKKMDLKDRYSSVEKANAAAEANLKNLEKRYIKEELEHAMEEDDGKAKVQASTGKDGLKSWKWSFKMTDNGYENKWLCEGSVRSVKVRVE